MLRKQWLCCDIAGLVRSGSCGRGLICLLSSCGFAYATQSHLSLLACISLHAVDQLIVCVCLQALFSFGIDLCPKSLPLILFEKAVLKMLEKPFVLVSPISLPAWCLLCVPYRMFLLLTPQAWFSALLHPLSTTCSYHFQVSLWLTKSPELVAGLYSWLLLAKQCIPDTAVLQHVG